MTRRSTLAWRWGAGLLSVAGTACLITAVTLMTPSVTSTSAPVDPAPPAASGLTGPTGPTGPPISERPVPTPRRLSIDAIGVSTAVIPLGLRDDGTVEVPADPDQAGWFDLGPVPGNVGSSVLLGHVDSRTGPAVFARLSQVTRGTEISVELTNGRTRRFVARAVRTYANADFPATKVYAGRGGRALNIVTCGGAYDAARGGYQSNVVVYAHRV